MKQTAVEWFFWKLYILKEVQYESIMGLYEQAKEMEKGQIIEAREDGILNAMNGYGLNSENYYNETFKSEKDGRLH